MIPGDPRRSRLRWLFLATAAFVLAQIAGKEVYPGLHAPGFGHPGRLADLSRTPEPRAVEVRVGFRDGGELAFRLIELLPRTHYKQRSLVQRALVGALESDPGTGTRDWLRRAVGARHPDREATRIEVVSVPRSGAGPVRLIFADEPGGGR